MDEVKYVAAVMAGFMIGITLATLLFLFVGL